MNSSGFTGRLKDLARFILGKVGLGKVGADLFYLFRSRAPARVFTGYLGGKFTNPRLAAPYLSAQSKFRATASSLQLSFDWFTDQIPQWLSVFQKYGLSSKERIYALEIGSWEGLSSFFLLHTLQNAVLTCVDTWEGGEEHRTEDAGMQEILSKAETTFDKNLLKYRDRLIKYKGTSYSFFNDNPATNRFDVIYVDGSHYCDDVVVDALKCFELLNVGGIMIFDDYFWRSSPRIADNPAAAINLFLKLKKGCYEIIRVYHQVIIEKTADQHR
jgi:predicted O-methyltransferase YrrM